MDRATRQKTSKAKEDFQNRINQLIMPHRHLIKSILQKRHKLDDKTSFDTFEMIEFIQRRFSDHME